jgi:aryl-alcohol dehydrogenase-like predicted oxidoreductase
MRSLFHTKFSRRSIMKSGLGAGIGMTLGWQTGLAAQGEKALPLITKPIPSTGEKLPVVGIGTNAYSVTAPDELAARREVLQNLPELGGKVVDTARVYGQSEEVIGQIVAGLGNRDKLFIATKTPMGGDFSNVAAVLQESFRRLQVERIDLMQVHNLQRTDELLPVMREWKQAGKIRYVGVTTSTEDQYPQMLDALRKYPLDFIQVDYSIENRGADREVLPLAKEKGVAVLVNMPLGGRRGNFMPKLADKKLPEWAAEYDAATWAQLLLKYNISHPAVTAVIPGTTKLSHLQDNQGAGRGKLPDAAGRKRIEQLWEKI